MNATHTLTNTGRMGALEALIRSDGVRQATRLLSFVVLGTAVGALLLAAAATLPVLFGYHTYTVNGGSMEPTLRLGSVAVAKPIAPAALEIGDIIAYRTSPDSTRVLHRVVGISEVDGKLAFFTQGDRNEAPDIEPVVPVGPGDKVVYSVPYAGYILNFAQSWPGRALLLGVPALALIATAGRDRRRAGASAQRAAEMPQPAAVPATPSQARPAAVPEVAPPAVAEAPWSVEQTVGIVLTHLPGFQTLVEAQRALGRLPGAKEATVVAYRDGQALLEVTLGGAVSAREIVQRLRAATGLAIVREAAPDERLRLRVLDTQGRALARRAA